MALTDFSITNGCLCVSYEESAWKKIYFGAIKGKIFPTFSKDDKENPVGVSIQINEDIYDFNYFQDVEINATNYSNWGDLQTAAIQLFRTFTYTNPAY